MSHAAWFGRRKATSLSASSEVEYGFSALRADVEDVALSSGDALLELSLREPLVEHAILPRSQRTSGDAMLADLSGRRATLRIMSNGYGDARLRELAFLARLERESSLKVTIEDVRQDPAVKSMLVHLLNEGLVNGFDTLPWAAGEAAGAARIEGMTLVQFRREDRLARDIANMLSGQEVLLRISHKGRVRRSELEQALRTGRDREPYGILWAERHRDQAVAMAVLTAGASAPVSLLYLDMNGLKTINDDNSHSAGDAAIKVYLQGIAMVTGDAGEAFRSGGADEVLVVLRAAPADHARDVGRNVLRQLWKERVLVDGKVAAPHLTAACGVVTTTDPVADAAALIGRADAEQKRAKEASKGTERTSVLAVEGQELEKVTLNGG
jgi:diguanylate cyclase (GGDEF)-like protein